MGAMVAVDGAASTAKRDIVRRVQDLMAREAAEPTLVLAAMAEARQMNAADLIKAVLTLERNRLHFRALGVAQQIWNEDARRRVDEDWQNHPRYTVRVHSRMFNVTIEWGRKVFFRQGGKPRVLFKWLARGRRDGMDLSVFVDAAKWEVDQISKAESEFASIRVHGAYLARLGRYLRFDPDAQTPATVKPMYFDTEDMSLR